MLSAALLPDIPGLLVEQVIIGAELITLVVRMTTPAVNCPACHASTTCVHSRSRRIASRSASWWTSSADLAPDATVLLC
jgi:transposase-like protein